MYITKQSEKLCYVQSSQATLAVYSLALYTTQTTTQEVITYARSHDSREGEGHQSSDHHDKV